jgi:hypothetical protein
MKLNHRIFFISAAIFVSMIQAQAQEKNQIPNLASSRKIAPPAYALNRIPKGGKSRFYGAALFGAPLNQEVRIHLYQWPQDNPPPPDPTGRRFDSDQNYRVDIFVRKQKKGAQFHLTQAVDIKSSAFGSERYAFDRVGLKANYLSPKNPEMPMFDLTCTVTDGFYGSFGTDIMMVFNDGWKKKPYVEAFEFHGNHFDSIYTGLNLDSRGIVQVLRYTTISGVDARTTQYWPWNGQKFVHTETETYGADVENPGRYPVKPPDE